MSYITHDYSCTECSHRWTELCDRDNVQQQLPCQECGAKADKVYWVTVSTEKTSASIPDGVVKRTEFKEGQRLRKELRNNRNNKAEKARIKSEMRKLGVKPR